MKTAKAILNMLVLSGLLTLTSLAVQAADSKWHTDTKSYRVYLGVVPASVINDNPKLVDQDRDLHGGTHQTKASSQHIMISIFNKNGNKRVLNATAIAKVRYKKLIGGENTLKPMEKMLTSGTVSYGNYFELAKKGDYVIEVDIYESNKSGFEKAAFNFKTY